MDALRDNVSCIGWVMFALACAGSGNDGSRLGAGGAKTMAGAAGEGVAGRPAVSSGGATSGAGGAPGAGQSSGGQATNGGIGAGGAAAGASAGAGVTAGLGGRSGAGGGSNNGGAFSRGGRVAGGGRPGGAAGATAGSSPGGASSAGASSVGGAGACVQDLACTLAALPASDDLHQDCVDRINQFRTQCACLPALARWTDGEACADQMSEYDAMQDTAHAGFEAGICDSGKGGQNECPGYSSDAQVISLCLQQMWSEGPGTQNPCNGQCFEDHGHFINMTSTTMTKVACGFYTTSSGKVWAAQNFSR
jgi:hypothetical protein